MNAIVRLNKGILLLIFIFPFATKAQDKSSKDNQEIYNTVILIGNAWTQNNLDTLEKYIHKDYLHTDVTGHILSRADWLGYVKDRKDKNLTNPGLEFKDLHIAVHDDIAFVTGINVFSGAAFTTNDNNAAKSRNLRFTQVLKKENGVWERILFQATYIEAP